jgi:hypothetical protein
MASAGARGRGRAPPPPPQPEPVVDEGGEEAPPPLDDGEPASDQQQQQQQQQDGGEGQAEGEPVYDEEPQPQPVQRNAPRRPAGGAAQVRGGAAQRSNGGRPAGNNQNARGGNNNNARGGGRGNQGGGGNNAAMADDGGGEADNGPLPTNPEERDKEIKRRESARKTREKRERLQPSNDRPVDFNGRNGVAVKLAALNTSLLSLDVKVKKAGDNAMYFGTQLYRGQMGPTVQVVGRLTGDPSVNDFDNTNYNVEIEDPREANNLREMQSNFKRNFEMLAVKHSWPFAGPFLQAKQIMQYTPIYTEGKAKDKALREQYPVLPPDGIIDGVKIETYPMRFKGQLAFNKKTGNMETEAMDENRVPMNPYDLKRGNLVRMAVKLSYFYYKSMNNSPVVGIPSKLVMIQRLDQNVAGDSSARRVKWAEDDDMPIDHADLHPDGAVPAGSAAASAAPAKQKEDAAAAALQQAAAMLDGPLRHQLQAGAAPAAHPPGGHTVALQSSVPPPAAPHAPHAPPASAAASKAAHPPGASTKPTSSAAATAAAASGGGGGPSAAGGAAASTNKAGDEKHAAAGGGNRTTDEKHK